MFVEEKYPLKKHITKDRFFYGKTDNGVPEGSRFDKNPDLKRILDKYFGEDKKEKTVKALNEFSDLAK